MLVQAFASSQLLKNIKITQDKLSKVFVPFYLMANLKLVDIWRQKIAIQKTTYFSE